MASKDRNTLKTETDTIITPGVSGGIRAVNDNTLRNDVLDSVITFLDASPTEAFNAELSFNDQRTKYVTHQLAGNLSFTLAASGNILGAVIVLTLLPDNTSTISFSSDFVDLNNNNFADFNNTSTNKVYMYFDIDGKVYVNIKSLAPQQQLTTPTLTASPADSAVNLQISNVDPNAISQVLEFYPDTDPLNWQAVPGYDGVSLTYQHSGLDNGTEYFYRVKSTATGYQDSDYATDSATPEVGIEPEVVTFVSAPYANIADNTIITALDTLVKGLKSNNLWTKAFVIYPLVGDNVGKTYQVQHNYNLKDASLYALDYANAGTGQAHDANGVQYSSGWNTLNNQTPFNTTDIDAQKLSLGVYGNDTADANRDDINTTTSVRLRCQTSSRVQFFAQETGVNLQATPYDLQGFACGSITDTLIFVQLDGATIDSENTFTLANLNTETFKMGSPAGNDHRLYWFGQELSEAEATTLEGLITAFQTTLGRNV